MEERPYRLTRRGFLAGTIAAALAACSDGEEAAPTTTSAAPDTTAAPATTGPTTTDAATTTEVTTTTDAASTTVPVASGFALGVASGDPTSDSVILWTRVTADEPLPDEDLSVEWEVATDVGMENVIAGGVATAVAALGHSVHVDVQGLPADSELYYRFRSGDGSETEPARTRTFPTSDAVPERFRFAFSSCQNWEQGYYAAYRDLVDQGDLDAFVFLGDYIYEYASGGYADPRGRRTEQDFECVTLDQYRERYALYHSDPLLQAAHARVPWIVTWDDHEVDNDYADDVSQDQDVLDAFLARRAAAYQAWYEHMPVRLPPPDGPDYPIYRSFDVGQLLRFHVLDTRQYRSDQQDGPAFIESIGQAVQVRDDALMADPDRTMLGTEQREWLYGSVAESTAVWDVLAQQVFMFGANAIGGSEPPIVVVDTWDGYSAERTAVLEQIAQTVDNLVVLTGDFHSAAVGDLRTDPFDPTGPIVGTEFMASAISSAFFDDNNDVTGLVAAAIAANPQILFFDGRRGYTICDVTPTEWRSTYRAVVDPFDEGSAVETISEWQVTAGTPGATRLS